MLHGDIQTYQYGALALGKPLERSKHAQKYPICDGCNKPKRTPHCRLRSVGAIYFSGRTLHYLSHLGRSDKASEAASIRPGRSRGCWLARRGPVDTAYLSAGQPLEGRDGVSSYMYLTYLYKVRYLYAVIRNAYGTCMSMSTRVLLPVYIYEDINVYTYKYEYRYH